MIGLSEIIQFESEDKSLKLDGIDLSSILARTNVIHWCCGCGMPGTQIVYNRWGSLWNRYLAQQGYIVFSMDARGMSGRDERFKNLTMVICRNISPLIQRQVLST